MERHRLHGCGTPGPHGHPAPVWGGACRGGRGPERRSRERGALRRIGTALAITPSSVTVAPGASQTFTVSGGSGTGYGWAVATNNSGGAITVAGVYTAGAMGGVTDVVRVTDSANQTATATVTVTASSTPLAIAPSSVTVAPGASQTFTVSGGSGTGYGWASSATIRGPPSPQPVSIPPVPWAASPTSVASRTPRTNRDGDRDGDGQLDTPQPGHAKRQSGRWGEQRLQCDRGGAFPILALSLLPLLWRSGGRRGQPGACRCSRGR